MLCSGGRFVVKFGGSSVRDYFEEAVSFASRLWDGNEIIVVVSALKRVTDSLLSIAEGRGSIEKIERLHVEFAEKNGIDPSILSPFLRELRGALASRDSFPSEEAFRDHVLSVGEMMSGALFAAALRNKGIPAVLFEPWKILRTDGRFGNARIDLPKSRNAAGLIDEALDEAFIPVVPGFIGGYDGFRTTLGRGGSDYTASAVATLTGAKGVFIMSDVDGIYTADPRRVTSAKLIPFVSSEEASIAAKLGMKALHPRAVEAAEGVPLYLGRTRDWHIGTVVGEESSGMPIVTHRVEGEEGIISVVGVESVREFPFESHEENGIPWVSIRVPRLRVGSALNTIHWEVVGSRVSISSTLSVVRMEAWIST
ncbi:MAG: aspartate kinase [Thermococcus sp.]|nr:aspartate kinase [Thermococcus sp.]